MEAGSARSSGHSGVETDVGKKGRGGGSRWTTQAVKQGARAASNLQGQEVVKDTETPKDGLREGTEAGGGTPGRTPVPTEKIQGARQACLRRT